MTVSLDEIMNELSADRRQKIKARAQQLIAEEQVRQLIAEEQVRQDLEPIVQIRRKL